MLRTYSAKPGEIPVKWHVLDAADRPLGRLANQVAHLLMGKHKPEYTRHVLTGDFVVVINAADVHVTGRKAEQQMYYRHSGYMGHLRRIPLGEMRARHPARVIELAVKGMLPKNHLAREMLRRLKVYAGPEHPHDAQVRGSALGGLLLRRPVRRIRRPVTSVSKHLSGPTETGEITEQVDSRKQTKLGTARKQRSEKAGTSSKDRGISSQKQQSATKKIRATAKRQPEKIDDTLGGPPEMPVKESVKTPRPRRVKRVSSSPAPKEND